LRQRRPYDRRLATARGTHPTHPTTTPIRGRTPAPKDLLPPRLPRRRRRRRASRRGNAPHHPLPHDAGRAATIGPPARGAVPAAGARAATGGPRAATENQPVERRDDRESLTGRIALSARCRRACPAPPAILFFLPSGRAIELLRLLAHCLFCLGRLATCFLLPSALRRLSHPCLPDPHWPADCKFRYKTFLTHSLLLFTCICIRWFRIISYPKGDCLLVDCVCPALVDCPCTFLLCT
jgi:hypothetical protein